MNKIEKNFDQITMELDCLEGIDCQDTDFRWECFGTICCEGTDFESLFQSAGGKSMDKDGGECRDFVVSDLPVILQSVVSNCILRELKKLSGRSDSETIAVDRNFEIVNDLKK